MRLQGTICDGLLPARPIPSVLCRQRNSVLRRQFQRRTHAADRLVMYQAGDVLEEAIEPNMAETKPGFVELGVDRLFLVGVGSAGVGQV